MLRWMLFTALVAGCSDAGGQFETTGPGPDPGPDAGVETDTDTGTGAGSDAGDDTGVDTDTDPCSGVVCDEPPADECVDANTLLMYAAAGECVDGECVYDYTDWPPCELGCVVLDGDDECFDPGTCYDQFCTVPPDDECVDENTLLTYESVGWCEDGECTYPSSAWPLCSDGCVELPGDDECAENLP